MDIINFPLPKQSRVLKDEHTWCVYCRELPDGKSWIKQENGLTFEDAIYYRDRNNAHNSETYETGCGKEFIAVKVTSIFEIL